MRHARRIRRRPFLRVLLDVAAAVAVLAALALAVDRVRFGAVEAIEGYARVSDGDSLVINGLRIRLEGIDAPELQQTCIRNGADYPCGQLARDALAAMVASRVVACESGGQDRYGRMLARCEAGGQDIAAAMVAQGWAVAYGGHEAAEAGARRAGRGIWAGSFERPQDWRRAQGAMTEDVDGRGIIALLRDLWHRWAGE